MNCPFCGQRMEHGYLQGRRDMGIAWMPDNDRKTPLLYTESYVEKHGGLLLGKCVGLRDGYRISFYLCRTCQKGVAELDE